MASIRREMWIDVPAEQAWEALRDVGAIHRRLARGFVTDVRLEEGSRWVTFANGSVVQELLVTLDEPAQRLVWAAVGGSMTHHNASAQVSPERGGTRFVWIADLLPDAVAPAIAAMIDEGMAAIRRTLEEG